MPPPTASKAPLRVKAVEEATGVLGSIRHGDSSIHSSCYHVKQLGKLVDPTQH